MKEKFYFPHMITAITWSKMSSAQRRQVGAVLARDEQILSIGYNGTLPGEDNICEELIDGQMVTKKTVIHAEKNCLAKMMNSNETSAGATLFVTTAPCLNCALDIILAKVKNVFYLEEYRDTAGIDFLVKRGIECVQLDMTRI
jgi:dCMP deaminase